MRGSQSQLALEKSNVVPLLINMLSSTQFERSEEIYLQCLNVLVPYCELSKDHQDQVAEKGIITPLQRLMSSSKIPTSIQERAITIFASLFNASEKTRELLWNKNALSTLFDLLRNDLWFVEGMEILATWAGFEAKKLELFLVSKEMADLAPLTSLFSEQRMKSPTFTRALNPLLTVLTKITGLNEVFAARGVIPKILKLLKHSHSEESAVSRLLLLKILNSILSRCSKPKHHFNENHLNEKMKKILKKSVLGVIEKELILTILQLDSELSNSKHLKNLKIQVESEKQEQAKRRELLPQFKRAQSQSQEHQVPPPALRELKRTQSDYVARIPADRDSELPKLSKNSKEKIENSLPTLDRSSDSQDSSKQDKSPDTDPTTPTKTALNLFKKEKLEKKDKKDRRDKKPKHIKKEKQQKKEKKE